MASFYGRTGIGAATVAAVAVVVLGLALGFWQLRRSDEKAAMQAAQDRSLAGPALVLGDASADKGFAGAESLPAPADLDGARVEVRGAFDAAHSIYLDNRTREGVAGFHVLTPVKLSGTDICVLVLRGWMARDPVERTRLPALQTPSGEVRVEGMAVLDLQQPMMLGKEPPPGPEDRLWQHFTYEEFEQWSDLKLYPVIVRQIVEPPYRDGLARDWNQPGVTVDRHRAYAFQWFALTAAALVTWLILFLRRRVSKNVE